MQNADLNTHGDGFEHQANCHRGPEVCFAELSSGGGVAGTQLIPAIWLTGFNITTPSSAWRAGFLVWDDGCGPGQLLPGGGGSHGGCPVAARF